VRVIVNEFGVYNKYAAAACRYRWLSDVRQAVESHGFGWTVWEYCTDFGIASGEPGARKLDLNAAAALGLKVAANPQ